MATSTKPWEEQTWKERWEDLEKKPFGFQLMVYSLFIKKRAEWLLQEIEKDVARIDSLDDPLEQAYLWAFWRTEMALRIPAKVEFPTKNVHDLNALLDTFRKVYGPDWPQSKMSPGPAEKLANDVAERLEWLKQCVAKDFESEVFRIVDRHNIVSPIEQIFLMEWCFAEIERRYGLKLHPQQPVRTASGEFVLDYVVTAANSSSAKFSVAIELDGHEFHEKTKEQAIRDKRRERAILHAGISDGLTVLRFSGSEIFRNCNGCIKEIVSFIEQKRNTTSEDSSVGS